MTCYFEPSLGIGLESRYCTPLRTGKNMFSVNLKSYAMETERILLKDFRMIWGVQVSWNM